MDVRDKITGLLEAAQFPQRAVFGVGLALEESLVNAMEHGNDSDPEKYVTVECCLTHESIRVVVTDEGNGFDLALVPNPTDDANLSKPSGRGLMLMKHFLTSVTHNTRGNQVILIKDRADDDAF